MLQRIEAVRQGASTRLKLGGPGHFPDELLELTTPKKPGPQLHQIRIVPARSALCQRSRCLTFVGTGSACAGGDFAVAKALKRQPEHNHASDRERIRSAESLGRNPP